MAVYGRVVRWSATLTSVVAVVAVALCAALIGAKGLYGALIGVGVVAAFFAIRLSRMNPARPAVDHESSLSPAPCSRYSTGYLRPLVS